MYAGVVPKCTVFQLFWLENRYRFLQLWFERLKAGMDFRGQGLVSRKSR